jgi:hypothetical protein
VVTDALRAAAVADSAVGGHQRGGGADGVGETVVSEFVDAVVIEEIGADEVAVARRADGQFEELTRGAAIGDSMADVAKQVAIEQ